MIAKMVSFEQPYDSIALVQSLTLVLHWVAVVYSKPAHWRVQVFFLLIAEGKRQKWVYLD